MKKTTNAITQAIAQPIFDGKTNDFIADLQILDGKNWEKDIASLGKKYGFKTEAIVHSIKSDLSSTFGLETLREELKAVQEKYSNYMSKFQEKSYEDASSIIAGISEYTLKIESNVKNTQDRLHRILLARPGVEEYFPGFQNIMKKYVSEEQPVDMVENTIDGDETDKMDIVDETEKTNEVVEIAEATEITESTPLPEISGKSKYGEIKKQKEKEKGEKEAEFFADMLIILNNEYLSDEDKKSQIEDAYKKMRGLTRMAWNSFYEMLGFGEEVRSAVKEVNLDILTTFVELQKDPNNSELSKQLTAYFEEYVKAKKKSQKEERLTELGKKIKGPKNVGSISLSEKDTHRFADLKKSKEEKIEKEEKEEKQAPTVDPLSFVGDTMSSKEFLNTIGLRDYKEIIEIADEQLEVPAIYFGPGKEVRGNKRMHFFTIGSENKDSNRVSINVTVVLPNSIDIKDDSVNKRIFKVRLLSVDTSSKREDPKKQTYQIRALIHENDVKPNTHSDEPSENGTHHTLAEIAKIRKLK